MAISVAKGNSQDPQTMGVRLLGGCVYYAEYGTLMGYASAENCEQLRIQLLQC